MKKWIILFIVLYFAANTAHAEEITQECRIYNALLVTVFARYERFYQEQQEDYIIIENTTTVRDSAFGKIYHNGAMIPIEERVPKIFLHAFYDFNRKRYDSSVIACDFTAGEKKNILLSKAEISRFFSTNRWWWEEFFPVYPNSFGIIKFSEIGLNIDQTKALVYVQYLCQELCGNTKYLLLGKKQGQWKVADVIHLSVN